MSPTKRKRDAPQADHQEVRVMHLDGVSMVLTGVLLAVCAEEEDSFQEEKAEQGASV